MKYTKKTTVGAGGPRRPDHNTVPGDRPFGTGRHRVPFDDEGPTDEFRTLELVSDETYDPYDRRKPAERVRRPKRDLRKLSEWIQMMRRLEERRRRGEDD